MAKKKSTSKTTPKKKVSDKAAVREIKSLERKDIHPNQKVQYSTDY